MGPSLSFIDRKNQSPRHVLPRGRSSVYKDWKRPVVLSKKKNRRRNHYREMKTISPFSRMWCLLLLDSLVFSLVLIELFDSSYFSRATATKVTDWTDVFSLCLALTVTVNRNIWFPTKCHLMQIFIYFFIFFFFSKMGCRFEP